MHTYWRTCSLVWIDLWLVHIVDTLLCCASVRCCAANYRPTACWTVFWEYGQNGDKLKRRNPKRRQEMVVLCEAFKQCFWSFLYWTVGLSFLPRYASTVCCCRVSLCLSHSGIYQTAKHRITQTKPHDSSGTWVFWCQRSWQNSNGITPYGSAKCMSGRLKLATVDE